MFFSNYTVYGMGYFNFFKEIKFLLSLMWLFPSIHDRYCIDRCNVLHCFLFRKIEISMTLQNTMMIFLKFQQVLAFLCHRLSFHLSNSVKRTVFILINQFRPFSNSRQIITNCSRALQIFSFFMEEKSYHIISNKAS